MQNCHVLLIRLYLGILPLPIFGRHFRSRRVTYYLRKTTVSKYAKARSFFHHRKVLSLYSLRVIESLDGVQQTHTSEEVQLLLLRSSQVNLFPEQYVFRLIWISNVSMLYVIIFQWRKNEQSLPT